MSDLKEIIQEYKVLNYKFRRLIGCYKILTKWFNESNINIIPHTKDHDKILNKENESQ